jgi:type II secretory pathway component GspD/PulD (secretin)
MKHLGLLGLSLVIFCSLARAETTRLRPLNFADASMVAALLGGVASGGNYSPDNMEHFARDTVAMGLRRLPSGEGQWAQNAEARSYPGDTGALLPLPEGISQRPVAIMQQNALLLRGTSEALDQLEELVRLLDRPVPMINVELKLLDQPEQTVDQWGIDFQSFNGAAAAGSAGNAPPTGLMLRYGVANLAGLLGLDRSRNRGNNVTAVNVTTLNDTDAACSFGETLPFFVSHVSYDALGNRHVDSEVYAVFTGVELFVHPRITGNDTVTMRLRPTLTEAAGQVTAPDGGNLPITRSVLTDTVVRIPDGESLVIGGFSRLNDSQMASFRTLLGERRTTSSSHPVLIVTPHIIRPQ